ncbi:MAG: class I SAM-dependent rRNA methyltransferase [Ruminococcaceae bacterium]|nr:class I SAM-dependent rRNA methyltransferase [Oscillospiraceae bacterium]
MSRIYPAATITAKAEKALRSGHVWVYGEEITAMSAPCENGALADVYTSKGRFMGTGFYNDNSKITIRLISRNANDRFDEAFWRRRLRYAIEYRQTVMGSDFSNCRLIFGEADSFPGLTVDRFENVLVVQTMSLGMEKLKDMMLPAMVEILADMGQQIDIVYERNDAALREKEGMSQGKGFYLGSGDGHVEICENGVRYDVDYINGQKTGFFLDQKYNRQAVARLAKGRRVLDCFTHTGAFALNAAAAGAESVCAVDVSADAIELAKANAVRNGLDGTMSFVKADVFDLLTQLHSEKRKDFDFIILDPPAFTKSGATVNSAIRGYREINSKAMRLLPRGGYLATCSCSHFMTDDLFRQMLKNAAADAAVSLRQIEARQQGPDHPILWNVPETDYLKFYIFQVV